ncbi:MAG: O-acetyl-ADP-ribose deacetylase [Clostridia bacterium]|nr:O-acetyl-ADP-ribose deacetylase [Clostridia bacterium]
MPLFIVENDITRMKCDAIVNAANRSLLGGGGVDGAIHAAAGPELLAECRTLGGCETGGAKITGGYLLPAKRVIHTVGPVWRGGANGEEDLLRSCYRRSLALAEENGCETVAFPLISAGAYGYPKRAAFEVAVDEITAFLRGSEMTVYIVVYRREEALFDEAVTASVAEALRDSAEPEPVNAAEPRAREKRLFSPLAKRAAPRRRETEEYCDSAAGRFAMLAEPCGSAAPELENQLRDLDESFSQSLLRRIDEKGMTDVECYKRANVDRKLFSKIRGDAGYRPSKQTAVAFAIALRLSRAETDDLLMKAGFALSRSSKFDVIISYFIARGDYDVNRVNEALFAFDQPLLGC